MLICPLLGTSNSVDSALELAIQAHRGMLREGPDPLPYITHPIEVVLNLRYVGGVCDPELLCAGALHDTVECQCCTHAKIEMSFGPRVAGLVRELTRTEPEPAQIQGLSKDEIWLLRAQMLLDEVAKMSTDAQIIKLADRLSNVQDAIRLKSPKKLKRYLGQTQKMLDVIPKSVNRPLWEAVKGFADTG